MHSTIRHEQSSTSSTTAWHYTKAEHYTVAQGVWQLLTAIVCHAVSNILIKLHHYNTTKGCMCTTFISKNIYLYAYKMFGWLYASVLYSAAHATPPVIACREKGFYPCLIITRTIHLELPLFITRVCLTSSTLHWSHGKAITEETAKVRKIQTNTI